MTNSLQALNDEATADEGKLWRHVKQWHVDVGARPPGTARYQKVDEILCSLLDRAYQMGRHDEQQAELLLCAQAAVDRMNADGQIDFEKWANSLAEEFSKYTD